MLSQVGNRAGWGIAAAVFVAFAGALVAVEAGGAPTAPTGLTTAPGALSALELVVSPATVTPESRGDGTAALREIIAEVERGRETYSAFVEAPGVMREMIPRVGAIDGVARQASYATGAPWANAPEEVVLYDGVDGAERRGLSALRLAGHAAGKVALFLRTQGRAEEARSLFEGELSLGAKVFAARQSHAEMSAGLGLMGEAAGGLKLLARDAKDAAWLSRLEAFEGGLGEVNARVAPVWAAISTVDPGVMGRHNGDVPLLATKAGERAWRVEATLKLGRMKFDVGDAGTPRDQRNAKRLLRTLAGDPDPAVARAAKLGSGLTVEQYRTLR